MGSWPSLLGFLEFGATRENRAGSCTCRGLPVCAFRASEDPLRFTSVCIWGSTQSWGELPRSFRGNSTWNSQGVWNSAYSLLLDREPSFWTGHGQRTQKGLAAVGGIVIPLLPAALVSLEKIPKARLEKIKLFPIKLIVCQNKDEDFLKEMWNVQHTMKQGPQTKMINHSKKWKNTTHNEEKNQNQPRTDTEVRISKQGH